MFTLPNFCRVCLKYDKNLIDLEHIENEPSETLMTKLQHCVSEVEWTVFKPLLCHPCIKRLNIAYTFKKQCVQSATVLKSYVQLVKETKKKNESQPAAAESAGQGSAYMMLPNQKYIKIVMSPQNSFQNVFLNVVPTTSAVEIKNSKDTNQNVFHNINNTFQKFIPSQAVAEQKEKNLNVNQLLTDSKTEELSVEIDPMDFDLGDEGSSEGENENSANDWEELISQSQIPLGDAKDEARSNGTNFQNGNLDSKSNMYNNYVPILPKQAGSEEKNDFFYSGQHFLSSQSSTGDIVCEHCQKRFTTIKLLKYHIKEFHMGKLPFKCEFCYKDHLLRWHLEACIRSHKTETDPLDTSLTLSDFKATQAAIKDSSSLCSAIETKISANEEMNLTCDICLRVFNSPSGLLRHKVRKHNQQSKKKYFIKGMKNARCDICNREFSTQSYMQLHRKLHLRDDIGYKYKVFSKSRYLNASNDDVKSVNSDPLKSYEVKKKDKSKPAKVKPEPLSDSDEDKTGDSEPKSDNPIDSENSNNIVHTEIEIKMEIEDEEEIIEEEIIEDDCDENQDE